MIHTWKTKKEDDGKYTAVALQIGYKYTATLKRVEGFKTRAKAKRHAVKLTRYFKSLHK